MIKFNKRELISMVLAGSVALGAYGCTKDVKDKHDENNDTKLIAVEVTDTPIEKQTQYVNKRNEIMKAVIGNKIRVPKMYVKTNFTFFHPLVTTLNDITFLKSVSFYLLILLFL